MQTSVIVANGLPGYGRRSLEGSAVVAHEPSYPTGHMGSSWTRHQTRAPLHWQAESHPPCHQGSPPSTNLRIKLTNAVVFSLSLSAKQFQQSHLNDYLISLKSWGLNSRLLNGARAMMGFLLHQPAYGCNIIVQVISKRGYKSVEMGFSYRSLQY